MPRRTAYLSSFAIVLAACGGNGTAPQAPPHLADAARTANQLQGIDAPANTNVLISFTPLALQFIGTITGRQPLTPVARAAAPLRSYNAAGARAALLLRAALGTRAVATSALFADTLLGKTFEWDTAAHAYVASGAAGAPANGMRFLLYQVNALALTPALPLDPIGYVDLTDQSTSSTKALGVSVVGTVGVPVTYASYTVSGPAGGVSTGLTLAGFVTDNINRLDLNATLSFGLNGLTVHTTITVASLDASVDETVSTALSGSTESIAIDFTLTSHGEAVREAGTLAIDTTALTISGDLAVTLNDRAFATIGVSNSGLSYTGANGVTLTPEDRTALAALYIASADVFATAVLLSLPGLALGV